MEPDAPPSAPGAPARPIDWPAPRATTLQRSAREDLAVAGVFAGGVAVSLLAALALQPVPALLAIVVATAVAIWRRVSSPRREREKAIRAGRLPRDSGPQPSGSSRLAEIQRRGIEEDGETRRSLDRKTPALLGFLCSFTVIVALNGFTLVSTLSAVGVEAFFALMVLAAAAICAPIALVWAARHLWQGGIDVRWDRATLAPGRRAVFHVATTDGSGVLADARFLFRVVGTKRPGEAWSKSAGYSEVLVHWSAERTAAPHLAPGPGEFVRVEVDVPAWVVAQPKDRWEFVVHGKTLWGVETEVFLVPFGCVATPLAEADWPAPERGVVRPTVGRAVVRAVTFVVAFAFAWVVFGALAAGLRRVAWQFALTAMFARDGVAFLQARRKLRSSDRTERTPPSPGETRPAWRCRASGALEILTTVAALSSVLPLLFAVAPDEVPFWSFVCGGVWIWFGVAVLLHFWRGGLDLRWTLAEAAAGGRMTFDVCTVGGGGVLLDARYLLRCVATDPRWGLRIARGPKPRIAWMAAVAGGESAPAPGEAARIVFDVPAGLPAAGPGVDWQLVVDGRTPWGRLTETFPVPVR